MKQQKLEYIYFVSQAWQQNIYPSYSRYRKADELSAAYFCACEIIGLFDLTTVNDSSLKYGGIL